MTPETLSAAIGSRMQGVAPRQFWQSLDELAETDEFRQLIEREFPTQLSEWDDPVGRRRFLKLMGASLALAGVAGCSPEPEEKIVPYVRAPEEITPGEPLFYATAFEHGGYAQGLLVKSVMGRPIKIEGNPAHPASLGATDAFAQASILSLYDPDRSQTILRRGVIETWEGFFTTFTTAMVGLRERNGAGLRILTGTVTSPTLGRQLTALLEQLPEARWHQYEAINKDNSREGARRAFGVAVDALCHFDRAQVVLSLDADFLFAGAASVRQARDFMQRRTGGDLDKVQRLYVAESSPSLTGVAADHRLSLRPGQVLALAEEVARRLEVDLGQSAMGASADLPAGWVSAVVDDLRANRGAGLVVVGEGQPPEVHAIAHRINHALGNVGESVTFIEPVDARPENQLQSLSELVADMQAGKVDTLVILGANPVYEAPAELGFADALSKVALRAHLSSYYDETSFLCDWHVPEAHFLERWGDTRAYDGTVSIQQPLIAPLYGGKSASEVLAALTGTPLGAYEIVQETWQKALGEAEFTARWNRAVHDGVLADSAAQPVEVQLAAPAGDGAQPTVPAGEGLDIVFLPDATVWDGRYANNGWLQELPAPLTKLTWDNVASFSPATAKRLGLANEDVVEITLNGRSVKAPVWVLPGQPDDCVALTLGRGRTKAGRVGTGVGYSAYQILPARGAGFAAGGEVRKTGQKHLLSSTQTHHSMDGRDIVRVTTVEGVRHPQPPHGAHGAGPDGKFPTLYPDYEYSGNAWGMVVNQTSCIGCNACVVACQAENNIPIVGKEQIRVGREMHWLRIDRYYAGPLEKPETYFQPMACVHCENAPCEVVCPVAATVHDAEGTNNMIYNRCVGTRYCSNNCPYKVRRFNYLQYTDVTTPSLKLMRNPEVTVRNRGVMEKCTYCIQRISEARIVAKREDRPIRDGEVVTACQQACPTQAIVFGNLNDHQSQVHKQKQNPLNYGILAELGTNPRTTYLPRVVNPHGSLPEPSGVHPATGHESSPQQHEAHS